jgi:uncharacterized protein YkwD
MKKSLALILLVSFLPSACISISPATQAPTPAVEFVTSTLPPTKSLLLPATRTPVTGTPANTTPVVTSPPDCTHKAVLMEDVTIPDDTRLAAGENFTKTWRFKNTGSCNWTGHTINFLTGDRMGAPDASPIPDTLAGETVDISLELTAPSADGAYSGYFTLKDAAGESIDIGTEKTFWVKIIVGNPSASPTSTSAAASGGQASSSVECASSRNASFTSQIQSLINSARKQQGLPALTIDPTLTSAAQVHSQDMACNSLLSHTGSDGSSPYTRITAAGYTPSYSEEIIYAGGGPQAAFDWWMGDKPHHDAILNPKSIEMGTGYAYVENSTYGGYFTVDFASP